MISGKKIIGISIAAIIIYALIYFIINPPYVISFINDKQINSTAYSRDYILTVIPEGGSNEIPDMSVIINETVNTDMSEAYQTIDMSWDAQDFTWEKLYKFDTLITRTPYSSRNIGIYGYKEEGLVYNFTREQSKLLAIANEPWKANPLWSNYKYTQKKLNINFGNKESPITFSYGFEANPSLFKEVAEHVFNDETFSSFFKEDNAIQTKLGMTNSTKGLVDIFYNIKEGAVCENANVSTELKMNGTASVVLTFNLNYNGTKFSVTLSEYIKPLPSDTSPEDKVEIISITDIKELKPK